MSRNLQNCYCNHEAAERRAAQLTKQTGRLHLVYANALGYWEPIDVSGDEDEDEGNNRHAL